MEKYTEIIIAVLGILSSVVAWFLGKRKNEAEVTSIEIESLRAVIAQQNDQIKVLNDRIQELTNQVFGMQNEIMRLKSGTI